MPPRSVSIGIDSTLAWVRAVLAFGSAGAGEDLSLWEKPSGSGPVTEGNGASGVYLIPCLLPATRSLGSFGVIAIAVVEPLL